MNVTSGGPHILLFERDQQLTTLLSSELMQAGYEVHTARTAVEVFDAIARFPVRLVMVDLAQAQAGRREFWVALDAQRRGRGVQVFTFRCTNLGGYGPDDPDERVETVLTDLEVDGPGGVRHLLEAVHSRVPVSPALTSTAHRQALVASDAPYQNSRSVEAPPSLARQSSPVYQTLRQASPVYQSAHMPQVTPAYQSAPQPQVAPPQPPAQAPVYQSAPQPSAQAPVYQPAPQPPAPVQQSPMYQSAHMPQVTPPQSSAPVQQTITYQAPAQAQPLQGALRPQAQEVQAPPPPPARPAEPARSGHSTFTDKIRAVFYPSSQSFSAVAEAGAPAYQTSNQAQQAAPYQSPDVQPRPRASQRLAEAEYQASQNNREEMIYQSAVNQVPVAPTQPYSHYADAPTSAGQPESGLDQLTRMLRESQPSPQNTVMVNGQAQNSAPRPAAPLETQDTLDYRARQAPANPVMAASSHHPAVRPGLTIDPQEIQDFRSQILQAARQDEAHERSNVQQTRPEMPGISAQLRASPIQDVPFEQEIAHRKAQTVENLPRPALPGLQSAQAVPQTPSQPAFTDVTPYAGSSATQPRLAAPPETPAASANTSQLSTLPSPLEVSPQEEHLDKGASGTLNLEGEDVLPEEVRRTLQQNARRPEVKTSDDMLLDIVKSLPPMSPAPQPPQPQVLNGRATRSLGSVLLEGHLVPQERLQVAQHVQRMMRGVDLNYQLGEILLMFKLLTPDQLLAASLVSYGMISTVQISALGRIRQELHSMGLEYDLESLLVLFRILTPEQLREVRASWSS